MFRPGGQLHPQYFLEHKWNFIFEGILLVVIAYMFLQRSGPKKKQDRPLSEKVGLFGALRRDAPACLVDPHWLHCQSCLSCEGSHIGWVDSAQVCAQAQLQPVLCTSKGRRPCA